MRVREMALATFLVLLTGAPAAAQTAVTIEPTVGFLNLGRDQIGGARRVPGFFAQTTVDETDLMFGLRTTVPLGSAGRFLASYGFARHEVRTRFRPEESLIDPHNRLEVSGKGPLDVHVGRLEYEYPLVQDTGSGRQFLIYGGGGLIVLNPHKTTLMRFDDEIGNPAPFSQELDLVVNPLLIAGAGVRFPLGVSTAIRVDLRDNIQFCFPHRAEEPNHLCAGAASVLHHYELVAGVELAIR